MSVAVAPPPRYSAAPPAPSVSSGATPQWFRPLEVDLGPRHESSSEQSEARPQQQNRVPSLIHRITVESSEDGSSSGMNCPLRLMDRLLICTFWFHFRRIGHTHPPFVHTFHILEHCAAIAGRSKFFWTLFISAPCVCLLKSARLTSPLPFSSSDFPLLKFTFGG